MREISYFSALYDFIKYPISGEEEFGLRNAQLGAIHAIAANDTLEENGNSMIVMPTGARVIIVTGCINILISRVSETFIENNSCIS